MFKDYDYIIDYNPGKSNVVTNSLSIKEMEALLLRHSEWKIVFDGAILAQLKAHPILKQMIMMLRKMMKSCRKRYNWSEIVIKLIFQ